jgi:hypothetical protein
MKINKGILFSASIILIVIFISIDAQSHSASLIELQYDFGTKTLDVTVFHSVSDVNTHYIEEIKIYVNDVLNQTETYTSQTSTSKHEDSFIVNTAHNDVIKVQATCSVSGTLTEEIIVSDPVIPEFSMIFSLFSLLIIGSILGYVVHKKHTREK